MLPALGRASAPRGWKHAASGEFPKGATRLSLATTETSDTPRLRLPEKRTQYIVGTGDNSIAPFPNRNRLFRDAAKSGSAASRTVALCTTVCLPAAVYQHPRQFELAFFRACNPFFALQRLVRGNALRYAANSM